MWLTLLACLKIRVCMIFWKLRSIRKWNFFLQQYFACNKEFKLQKKTMKTFFIYFLFILIWALLCVIQNFDLQRSLLIINISFFRRYFCCVQQTANENRLCVRTVHCDWELRKQRSSRETQAEAHKKPDILFCWIFIEDEEKYLNGIYCIFVRKKIEIAAISIRPNGHVYIQRKQISRYSVSSWMSI